MVTKTNILDYFGGNFRPFFERYGLRFKDRKVQTLARCPWHDDQHPSLSINTREGTFYCHAGCGSGNIFDFYARMKELSINGEFSRIVQGIAEDFYIPGHRDKSEAPVKAPSHPRSGNLLQVHPIRSPGLTLSRSST